MRYYDKLELIKKKINENSIFIKKSQMSYLEDKNQYYINTDELDDCGNFAIALNRILLNKGDYLVLIDKSSKLIAYTFLQINYMIFNAFHVYKLQDFKEEGDKVDSLKTIRAFIQYMDEKYINDLPIFLYKEENKNKIKSDPEGDFYYIDSKNEHKIMEILNTTNEDRIKQIKFKLLSEIYGKELNTIDKYIPKF